MARFNFVGGCCLLVAWLTGCGSELFDADPAPVAQQDLAVPAWRNCALPRFAAAPAQGFHHASNTTLALKGPNHSVPDVLSIIAQTQADALLTGHLGYGGWQHGLISEDVSVFLNDCAGWQQVASTRTNTHGTINVDIDTTALGVGRFALANEVLGDASVAPANLFQVPSGTHVVVFDLDGTLTTDNRQIIAEIFAEIIARKYVPLAYPGAADMTRAWRDKGYVPIYLTGRPTYLAGMTRLWLEALAFAPGFTELSSSELALLPINAGVGDYKYHFLKYLIGKGLIVDYAYGDQGTDVYAYGKAGVQLKHTFIIGPHAGVGGTQGLTGGYDAHLAYIAAQPVATQPFAVASAP